MAAKSAGPPLSGHEPPAIENYATVEAHCEGVPVYAFGYSYVYGISPTFLEDVVWQDRAEAPPSKITPKKSWEIKSNRLGSTPAREPKTAAIDDQPLLCVHLIDGDPETCWCSRGQLRPDVEDVWIRIDLPRESQVSSVTLVPAKQGMWGFNPRHRGEREGQKPVGQALPRVLTVKVSRDAWHWDTVYQADELASSEEMDPIAIRFAPRPVKQVWIIGRHFPCVVSWGHGFSLSGVEVRDEQGNNLALHSRGAGVTVSSTQLGYGMDRFTQDMLWPIQYDLGFKWSRVGYDMSAFQWAYVEREKGQFAVDRKADAAVTEAVNNGINVLMVLDKGNWLYAPEPRQPDRTRELVETYYNEPPCPLVDKDYLEAWLRYVRFMVKHFKDRIQYFEIWNEWTPHTEDGAREFCKLAKPTIAVIREEYPEAKILLASPGFSLEFIEGYLKEGLGPDLDAIGLHPWYQADPESEAFRNYPNTIRELKRMAESYGFAGEYMATEWTWFAPYPPHADRDLQVSEMQKAKYAARLTVTHVALDIVSFWNETFQTQMGARYEVSLLRNTFSADPICPTQPQPIYYVLRTLSTVLEDVTPISLDISFTNTTSDIEWYAFIRGEGETLLALWLPGRAGDGDEYHILTDIILPNGSYQVAVAYDVLNGITHRLNLTQQGADSVLPGMRVRDWPVVLALT